MHEQTPVFQISLDTIDILLSASDFYALLVESDFKIQKAADSASNFLLYKENLIPCFFLEEYLEGFFKTPETRITASESVAFLLKTAAQEKEAFILQKNFEMHNYPVREFKNLPHCLRAKLRSKGIYAIRFDKNSRIQYLINFNVYKKMQKIGVEP